jgi:hypothetical protein
VAPELLQPNDSIQIVAPELLQPNKATWLMSWLAVHILKHYSHQTAQNQAGTNYTRIQHTIKMAHSEECSLFRVDSVHIFCHHVMSTKSTINDTTFSSGIIKKRRKATENTLPVFHVSYTVLFLPLNILRLSAMPQLGHKPMFWRPTLPPTAGSVQ